MDNDQPAADGADNAPAEVPFIEQPWQVLIGLRATADKASGADGMLMGMAADESVLQQTSQGMRPDQTQPVVHFAQWLDRNKSHLMAIWEREYTQYMSLRSVTEGRDSLLRRSAIRVVDAQGTPIQ